MEREVVEEVQCQSPSGAILEASRVANSINMRLETGKEARPGANDHLNKWASAHAQDLWQVSRRYDRGQLVEMDHPANWPVEGIDLGRLEVY